ncbi:hypothetical protein [Micromonospora fluostatini]|uniref:hypothetical protein n=1 Tax=Micromonospora sp. JCM 30529 TaxID=3421643 RepID=UPI003D17E8B8
MVDLPAGGRVDAGGALPGIDLDPTGNRVMSPTSTSSRAVWGDFDQRRKFR